MSEQFSLLDPQAPVREHKIDRLFFAYLPPSSIADQISALTQVLKARLRLSGPAHKTSRLHVTLLHLGDFHRFPKAIAEMACRMAATISVGEFSFELDSAGSFQNPWKPNHPLVLLGGKGVAMLMEFQRVLNLRMRQAGLCKEIDENFNPHMTLLYHKSLVERCMIDPIHFPMGEFVLIHSLVGLTEHRILGRWPLTPKH